MNQETRIRPRRIPALLQAAVVVVAAYVIFDRAFPPVMPKSSMVEYMIITVIGVLLYFSFDDERWAEFKAPLLATLRRPALWPLRWGLLVVLPGLVAYAVFDVVRPSSDAPVELRQVHPAPPSRLRVYNREHNLTTLENPVRRQVLDLLASDRDKAMEKYQSAVAAGAKIYYQNCFFCHGDLLEGRGPFARALQPLPANFQDVGTIAQLQEAFLFWRITTGGPGLPREGAPWNSAMPVWHEMLKEQQVWQVITFLYDHVGQVPRMWDASVSKAVTALRDEVEQRRAALDGKALYQFRCAVCHGKTGAGDGPAAEFLYPKPRDFTLGEFKFKTSPGSLLPRDEDLVNVIKHGLEGTAMPAWEALLSDAQIRSLIPVLKGLDTSATWAPEDAEDTDFNDEGLYLKSDFQVVTEVEPVPGRVAYSQESIQRGRKVFEKVCEKCHGEQGRGNITSGKRLEDDWGARIWPRDLTKPWTWRVSNVAGGDDKARDATINRIYQRLSIGIPGTPMPAHRAEEEGNEDPVSLEDRWNVANYVYSLRVGAPPPPDGGGLITARKIDGPLPATGDDPRWEEVPPITLRLAPNVIKEQRLFTPLSDAISVRVLYNETEIAFLLELDDRTDSRPGEETSEGIQDENLKMFSDAFAIQFPKAEAYVAAPVVEKPLFRHGDRRHPTTIWYWNAGSVKPVVAPRTTVFDAKGPNEKLAPRAGSYHLGATGNWQAGRWRVVMRRSRSAAADTGDVAFEEGNFIPVAFASWDGSNGEVGSKHTFTPWHWLLLPRAPNLAKVYGLPAGAGLAFFVAGLVLVRHQRHRASVTPST